MLKEKQLRKYGWVVSVPSQTQTTNIFDTLNTKSVQTQRSGTVSHLHKHLRAQTHEITTSKHGTPETLATSRYSMYTPQHVCDCISLFLELQFGI